MRLICFISGRKSVSNKGTVFHAAALKLKWIAPRRAFGTVPGTSAQLSAWAADLPAQAIGDAAAPAAATPAAAPRKPRRSRRRASRVSSLILPPLATPSPHDLLKHRPGGY